MKTYPFVAPYCRYMGSYDYYRAAEIDRLRAMDAPNDAYATKHGGGFYTVSGLLEMNKEHSLAQRLQRMANVTVNEALGLA